MASMLSLNDDCLYAIVSCLDDPSSIYSFALTCKRFLQVTKNARNVLHPSLLRTKAEYYIKCYIVDIGSGDYGKLDNLLQVSTRFTAAKGVLTYAKVVDQWQRNGPVAAELFTWIRKKTSSKTTCKLVNEYSSVTLHLPSCKKSMVIDSYYVTMNPGENDWDELGIHVNCGDLDITSVSSHSHSPKYYLLWDEDKVKSSVEPFKPAIELLQEELGDTIPPITGHFFIWLCCLFPDTVNLREESRLSFKDAVRNTRPSPDAVQSGADLCRQEHEAKLQSVLSEWKKDDEQESKYSKTVASAIDLLIRRSGTKVFLGLEEDASRFYYLASGRELKLLPKQLLLELVLRTSFEEGSYKRDLLYHDYVRYAENSAWFKCLERIAMKVRISNFDPEELELEFTLPDGRVLKFCAGYKNFIKLSPVTELLQQVINQIMQGEKYIPEINNRFTAVYFINAMQISGPSEIF